MSQPDLQRELGSTPAEPLLPIKKKLIVWSLTIGIVLLIVLTILARLAPATL
jgi:hypothetical protein